MDQSNVSLLSPTPEVEQPRVCIRCRHFVIHKKVVTESRWKDDFKEIDSHGGDCRANPPVPGFFTDRARWPFVLTGESCSHFKAL